MAGNIFINYRRDESGHVAGRLHDSLAPTFGRTKLFMDVDNIPVGRDFEEYLKSQVAACDAMLAVIGPNWLAAKDEAGKRRLDNPEDFIVIEIGAALARNIPVVPVLVDGARMPKASELPDSLKLLAKRQAVEVRHTNFSRDAEALIKRLRAALGYDSGRQRRVQAAKVIAALAVAILIGWAGVKFLEFAVTDMKVAVQEARQAERDNQKAGFEAAVKAERDRQAAESEAKRKAEEAAVKAEQERQARAAADAEAKRKAEEAEQQRVAAAKAEQERQAAIKAEQERKAKAAAEAEAKPSVTDAPIRLGIPVVETDAQRKAEQERQAKFEEAQKVRRESSAAYERGAAAMLINDNHLAIREFSEAIRLFPNYATAFCQRGFAKLRVGDESGKEDIEKAKQLSPKNRTCGFG